MYPPGGLVLPSIPMASEDHITISLSPLVMKAQTDSKEIGLHDELPCSHPPALIIINFYLLVFVLYVLVIH